MSLLLVRTVANCITLDGRIAVCAIGAGEVEPGETDCGVVKRTPLIAGTCRTPDDEHPAIHKLAISAMPPDIGLMRTEPAHDILSNVPEVIVGA